MRANLVFVYNADSGLFNTLTDIAHKILSPATYDCQLCALTHGNFRVRDEWVKFLGTLDADCEFLHRDEFIRHYGTINSALPVIFRKTADGLSVLVDTQTLQRTETLEALEALLLDRLSC